MPASRIGLALVAAAGLIASGTGGVCAARFVTGSMTPFYGDAAPPSPIEAPPIVANEPATAAPPEPFAPMPASYWSAAPALAAVPAAADDRRWERESEADARRWQAHIDAEVRAAQQQAGTDDAAPEPPAADGPPVDGPHSPPDTDAGPTPGS